MGQIPPLAGESQSGASLQVGYFAQAHEDLHPSWTLMEEIQAADARLLPAAVRDYLAKFLFRGDDVFKKVEVLSGGERGRLALACLALQGANLLLLDEPTNHLDLPSQEVLQSILADFNGTILLVSHDRYLIDSLATQVWEVLPDKCTLRIFKGSYSEYKTAQQNDHETQPAPVNQKKPVKEQAPLPTAAPLSKNELYRRGLALEKLEKEISDLEKDLKEIEAQLENPPADLSRVEELGHQYQRIQTELDECYAAWEKFH